MAGTSSPNSLGLDFDQLQIQEQPIQQEGSVTPSPTDSPQTFPEDHIEVKDKKKAYNYVNPERVKTGGNQRVSWNVHLFNSYSST